MNYYCRGKNTFGLMAWNFVIIIAFIFGTAGIVQARSHVGELVISKGYVKVRYVSGKEVFYRQLNKPIPVHIGDVVQSGPKSKARISFRDDREVVSIYSETSFKVAELNPRSTIFGLNIGKALFSIVAKFRRNNFQVKTATATIGVKGTEFITGTDGQNTFVMTLKGVVTAASVSFPNVTVEVTPNMATSIQANKTPTAPVVVPPEARDSIISGEGLTEMDDIPYSEPVPVTQGTDGEGEGGEDEGGEEEGAVEGDATETSEAAEQNEITEAISEAQETQAAVEETQEIIQDNTQDARPSGDITPSSGSVNININR